MFSQVKSVAVFGLLVVGCGLNIAATEKQTFGRGRSELHSVSNYVKKKELVLYLMCLQSLPTIVRANVTPKNVSLPHKFNATTFRIDQYGFIIDVKRTDQPTGWDMMLVVNWMFHSGNGIEYNGQIIWMPDPSNEVVQNRSQAVKTCGSFGGRLVDILDKKMYDVVYKYVQTNNGRSLIRVWLGMNYNPQTQTVTTGEGQPAYDPASHNDWRIDHPNPKASYTGLLLVVRDYVTNATGVRNEDPDLKRSVLIDLCTIKI